MHRSELVPMRFEIGILALLQALCCVCIDVQGCGNIGMPQRILNHLHVDASLAKPGGECMSQNVTAEVGEKQGILRSF